MGAVPPEPHQYFRGWVRQMQACPPDDLAAACQTGTGRRAQCWCQWRAYGPSQSRGTGGPGGTVAWRVCQGLRACFCGAGCGSASPATSALGPGGLVGGAQQIQKPRRAADARGRRGRGWTNGTPGNEAWVSAVASAAGGCGAGAGSRSQRCGPVGVTAQNASENRVEGGCSAKASRSPCGTTGAQCHSFCITWLLVVVICSGQKRGGGRSFVGESRMPVHCPRLQPAAPSRPLPCQCCQASQMVIPSVKFGGYSPPQRI